MVLSFEPEKRKDSPSDNSKLVTAERWPLFLDLCTRNATIASLGSNASFEHFEISRQTTTPLSSPEYRQFPSFEIFSTTTEASWLVGSLNSPITSRLCESKMSID